MEDNTMHLVIIYGPPGVGKFTVAKELVKKTGYRLLHNHAVVANAVATLFPFGTKAFAELAENVRLSFIKATLKARTSGLVLTYAYGVETHGGRHEAAALRRILRLVKKYHGKVSFVRLICEPREHKHRLQGTERKKLNKLTNPRILGVLQRRYRVGEPIPFVKSFTIDTTHISPQKATRLIQEELTL